MPVPKPPHLPQEIVNSVIESLPTHIGDSFESEPPSTQRALLACTRVSRSFRAPARRRLFDTIRIACPRPVLKDKYKARPRNGKWVHKMVVALLDLLRGSPDLVTLVRRVHIDIDDDTNMMHDPSGLVDILELLSLEAKNLHVLSLDGYERRKAYWHRFGERTQRALLNLCESGRVDGLRFVDVLEIPANVITGCAPLRSLELVRVTFARAPGPKSQSPAARAANWRPSGLENVSIHKCLTEFVFVCADLNLSNITSLRASVDTSEQDATTARHLTQHASNSLQVLDLKCHQLLAHTSIDLGLLPSLQTLRLRTSVPPRQTLSAPTSILRYLKSLSKPSNIEVLSLIYSTTLVKHATFIPKPGDYNSNIWKGLHPARLPRDLDNNNCNYPLLKELWMKLDVRLLRDAKGRLDPVPLNLKPWEGKMAGQLRALICTPLVGDNEPVLEKAVRVEVGMWVFDFEA